jgi:pimeloyl-ACP methyl ester carboxylesterase
MQEARMAAATHAATTLAFDDVGTGAPVVFLHGLTFDRRTWNPIIDRLDGVRSISIDLPAHGESGGTPVLLAEVAAQVHELLGSLGVESPIVVGHSMSAGVAASFAAAHSTAGVVFVDSGPEVRPFAQLVQELEPMLRGRQFHAVWQRFEDSLGLDLIPEPHRSLVLETHKVDQEVVLGYWDELLQASPETIQELVDAQVRMIDAPVLGVFGRPVTPGERERFGWVPEAELEEWAGGGHFVHVVDPDRFAVRLREFVGRCAAKA